MTCPPDRGDAALGTVPIAFWLMPCETDARWLRDRIRQLAHSHGGPDFDPHITLHVANCPPGIDPRRVTGALAARWPPLRLSASATGESAAYFKALYVDIAADRLDGMHLAELRRQLLRELLAACNDRMQGPATRGEAAAPSIAQADPERAGDAYSFLPHMSLLYGNLPQRTRTELAAQNRLDDIGIVFDRIAAVRPAQGHSDLSQVARWELCGCRRLSGTGFRA